MNEEIEAYQFLYFRDGNTESFIDYSKLVRHYNMYLSIFFDSIYSCYMNMTFLSLAVYGFSYFHRFLFDEKDYPLLLDVTDFILSSDNKVRNLSLTEKPVLTDSERNFIYSTSCANLIRERGLEEFAVEVINEMYCNSYRIHEVYQNAKVNAKGM